jgi:hypothetical protein
MDAFTSAERFHQIVHPVLEGSRAQIQHPYATPEVLEAKLGPMGAERRDRATAFRVVVAPFERSRMLLQRIPQHEIGRIERQVLPQLPSLEASELPTDMYCRQHGAMGAVKQEHEGLVGDRALPMEVGRLEPDDD